MKIAVIYTTNECQPKAVIFFKFKFLIRTIPRTLQNIFFLNQCYYIASSDK